MRPLFTIHAGEYLVGSYIEQHYRKWNVWVPAKDSGIDLLITNSTRRQSVSLQVKFSKDYPPTRSPLLQAKLKATGWWTFQERKIKASQADLWVLTLPSLTDNQTSFIIIPPAELLRRLHAIHGQTNKRIQSYVCVTRTGRCWETRDLPVADQELLAFDRLTNKDRDFSSFLNAWGEVEHRMKA